MIENGWYSKAIRMASLNYNARPSDTSVSLLVIHNISLPPGEFGGGFVQDFFLNQLNPSIHPFFEEIQSLQVSAHCFISRLGEVTQFVSFDERAWHAGRSCFNSETECNDFGIGIELEGTDDIAYTAEQYSSLVELTVKLMHKYPKITLDRIVGHCDIAPERKTDPGSSFDWDDYKTMINAQMRGER